MRAFHENPDSIYTEVSKGAKISNRYNHMNELTFINP